MDKKDLVEGEFKSYNFLSPFDTILSNKTVYELTKKFTLKSMLSDGYKPKELIYDLYEMTEEEYTEDLLADMSIVELSLGDRRYYVPVDRIVAKENTTNIHYGERSMVIKLGWIPESEDLSTLENDVKLLVEETLGISPVVGNTTISVQVSLTEQEHIDREEERDLLRQDPKNYKKKYYDLKELFGYMVNKLKALEIAEINSRLNP